MFRIGGLQLCLLAALALAPAADGAHLVEEPVPELATPGTPAQQIMRSEGLSARVLSSLGDQGVQASERSDARAQQRGNTAAQGLAGTVLGSPDPPLDAGIKLTYPSYPFFGSTVVAGDSAPAPSPVTTQYAPAPVQHGYAPAPVQHGYAPAPAQYAPAPVPAPAVVSAGVSRYPTR